MHTLSRTKEYQIHTRAMAVQFTDEKCLGVMITLILIICSLTVLLFGFDSSADCNGKVNAIGYAKAF